MTKLLFFIFVLISISHAVVVKAKLFRVTMYVNSIKYKCFYHYDTDTTSIFIKGGCPYEVTVDTESGKVFW